MSRYEVQWSVNDQGVRYGIAMEAEQLPVASWASAAPIVDAGPVLRRLADGTLDGEEGATEIHISHLVLAAFSDPELGLCRLPPRHPLRIDLQTRGTPGREGFGISATVRDGDGRPIGDFSRTGAVVSAGGRPAVLTQSAYLLLEEVASLNAQANMAGPDALARIARTLRFVGEGDGLDSFLDRITVVTADAFTLQPRADAGDVQFEPVLGNWVGTAVEGTDERFETSLPEDRHVDFVSSFHALGTGRDAYHAGQQWYVLPSPALKRALGVVHRYQRASADERRTFLARPQRALREEFGDEADDLIDRIFSDVGYADRVGGIAEWHAKVLPWVRKPAQPWLPPEELGVRIGEEYVAIPPDQVESAIACVQEAINRGEPTAEVGGHEVRADETTMEALRTLVSYTRPEPDHEPAGAVGAEEQTRRRQLVLVVSENFEVVEYSRETRPRVERQPLEVPASLETTLLSHQEEGLLWLQSHWNSGNPGVLLADDMGLGKTLQVLSFLVWVQEWQQRSGRRERKPFLVVAPTGLVQNWLSEHEIHFRSPGIGDAAVAYGRQLRPYRLGSTRGSRGNLDVARLRQSPWILTTYETWRDYQLDLGQIGFSVAVYDEAQRVKNPGTGVTMAAKGVKADFIVALTGTPVENRLADLWSIVDLVQPGRFGSLREFSTTYEKPDPPPYEALREELTGGDLPLMLRRLKSERLSGLPAKHEVTAECDMPVGQADVYDRAVRAARLRQDEPGSAFEAIQALRNISLHPGTSPEGEPDVEFIAGSARLTQTVTILDKVHEAGEKALVFVESRDMQNRLIGLLQRRYRMSRPPLVINGAVDGEQRLGRVQQFEHETGFDVMLLSPRAGGVGLTLVSANHVIHLSRWWNPAVEDQCTDRVFRIGQQRDVTVYYPMARHPRYDSASFDFRLADLLSRKRHMSRQVLAPTGFSKEDARRLFDETTGDV